MFILTDAPDVSSNISSTVADVFVLNRGQYERNRAITMRNWSSPFNVGETKYFLNASICGIITLDGNKRYKCTFQNLMPHYMGYGFTINNAEDNLRAAIHADFQYLYSMQTAQMTVSERKRWIVLRTVFDLSRCVNENPIKTTEIGRVTKILSNELDGKYRFKLKWLDGTQESATIEQVCPEIIRNRTMKYFEAVVLRNYSNNALIKIIAAKPTKIAAFVPRRDLDAFWDSLKESNAKMNVE